LAPSVGARVAEAGSNPTEWVLTLIAVAVGLEGWLIADTYYRRKPARPAKLAATMPGAYKLVANRYYVDELYRELVVKPVLYTSKYFLGPVIDTGILGGGAWLLGGIATFAGALLQRWQSGNLRSYAAWLAAGAAALLLFVLVPWSALLARLPNHLGIAGH
jgi:NADH-quinone oxidoreductase subunit L